MPGALLHNLKHNKVLHERIVLAHVEVDDTPIVPAAKRLVVNKLGKGFFTVIIHHGFFETPDVPLALQNARPFGLALDLETTTFFVGRETLVPAEHPALGQWRTWAYMRLASAALSPVKFYHLPPNRVVELGTQVSAILADGLWRLFSLVEQGSFRRRTNTTRAIVLRRPTRCAIRGPSQADGNRVETRKPRDRGRAAPH